MTEKYERDPDWNRACGEPVGPKLLPCCLLEGHREKHEPGLITEIAR